MARYVLVIKSAEDKEERYKARYVAGGNLDIMKEYLVHCAQTIQSVSIRNILAVAKIKAPCTWIVDAKLLFF